MLEEVTYKYLLAIIMSMILLIRLYFRFKFYHKTQKTSSSFKTREMIIAGSIGLSFSIPVLLYWFTNRIDFSELKPISPIDFIRENGKNGEMDIEVFVKRYDEATLDILKSKAEVFSPRPHLIKILE